MAYFAILLDSGAIRTFQALDLPDARLIVQRHQRLHREGVERRDLVTLRRAVALICIRPKPQKAIAAAMKARLALKPAPRARLTKQRQERTDAQ